MRTVRMLGLALLLARPAAAIDPSTCPAACAGDCDQGGTVTVDELVRGVGIALGTTALEECLPFDLDGDGSISVAELVRAVDGFLTECSGDPPPDRPAETLVLHTQWTSVAPEADPFAAMRPEGATCVPGAFRFEVISNERSLEIKTAQCSYLTVSQPVRTAVQRGDELYIRLAHFQLTAPAAAEVYMAVSFDECLIWEARRRIPAPSELIIERFAAPIDVPQGAPVYFHLQNHGANSYHLIEVSVGGSIADD